MNWLLILAVGYLLFVLAITFVHATQWADPNEDVMWGGWLDWVFFAAAFILGPYFILSGSSLPIVLVWSGMMLMEGAGALLHLMDR